MNEGATYHLQRRVIFAELAAWLSLVGPLIVCAFVAAFGSLGLSASVTGPATLGFAVCLASGIYSLWHRRHYTRKGTFWLAVLGVTLNIILGAVAGFAFLIDYGMGHSKVC